MPRGNDARAASNELAARFGLGGGNAEDLIQSARMKRDPLLRKASLLSSVEDHGLSEADVAKETGVKEDDIISFAVRGGYVIVVQEDARGDKYKTAFPLSSDKAAVKEAKAIEEGETTDEDADAHHQREARIWAAAQEQRENAESESRKAQEKAVEAQEKAAAKAAEAKS